MAREYQPITAETPYSSKAIDNAFSDRGDLEKYIQTLQKDAENPSATKKAGQLLRGDGNYYFQTGRSPRSDLEDALSETNSGMTDFAKLHRSRLKSELQAEDYVELVQRLPIYKTGNEEHDKLVDAMNNYRKLAEVSQDDNKKFKFIQDKVKKAPGWVQVSFARYGSRDFNLMFSSYMQNAQRDLASVMYDKDGNPRTEFLRKAVEDSLAEAEKAVGEETYSPGEAGDVYEANVQPYDLAFLEAAYKRLKVKDKDELVSAEKKDRDARRKERRDKGMPF